jgi:diguanylate cyclase (GGDEF)-like protein
MLERALASPHPLRRVVRAIALGLAQTALIVLLLEMGRRLRILGLPWSEVAPAREPLYLRALLLLLCGLTVWLAQAVLGDPEVQPVRRARVILGLRYTWGVVFFGVAFKFLEPDIGSTLHLYLLPFRAFSLLAVGYFFMAMVELYLSIQQRLARERELSAKLYEQSTTDALTLLPNRLLYNDRLEATLARTRRQGGTLAVFFLDLDRFKLVNDSLGHDAGDQVLKETARRLATCFRKSDAVCRIGGDEFLAFASDLSAGPRDVAVLCERVIEAMSHPIRIGDREIIVTISIGVALTPHDGTQANDLVKNADLAMYRAKQRGRNQFILYQPELNDAAIQRLTLENELRQAVVRDEFIVYYQPKVHAQTGHIIGVEALVRWDHPQRGLIPPSRFISVAEETRLIVPIDRAVMRKACAQLRTWHLAGHRNLRMSVNVSAHHFQTEDLLHAVSSVLADCQLSPTCLELELTESAVMHDIDAAIRILERLKQLGVSISIDDFGTGYSSLGYLKRFPFDCLKIDRTLISDGTESSNEAAIAKAIVALGHEFGVEVVAEGVETELQRDFLRRIGCTALQGYLFSKPVTGALFEALLERTAAGQALVEP